MGRSPKRRKLSDAELDSGDDEDRGDRMDEDVNEAQEESLKIIDYDLLRHGIPCCSDGEVSDAMGYVCSPLTNQQ